MSPYNPRPPSPSRLWYYTVLAIASVLIILGAASGLLVRSPWVMLSAAIACALGAVYCVLSPLHEGPWWRTLQAAVRGLRFPRA